MKKLKATSVDRQSQSSGFIREAAVQPLIVDQVYPLPKMTVSIGS